MMQGWTAPAPSRAHPYSVACAEGHRLHGMRTEGYQALRCPTCGDGIFVLPRSPLPEPPTPASSSRSRVAAAVEEAYPEDEPLVLSDPLPSMVAEADLDEPEAEIDWVDEVPAEPETPSKVEALPGQGPRPRPASKPDGRATSPSAKRPPAVPKAPEPEILVVPRTTLKDWARAHPNTLLVAGVILLVVGAVAFRWRRLRLEELPQIAEIGRTEGLKKLDAGEFHVAKKLLAEAADAVDELGGKFEGADAIRQGSLEAAIFADLASKEIAEIVEEAATTDAKEWSSHFSAMFKGRSVIIEAPVSGVPEPGRPGSTYEVDYPIYFGRGPKTDGKKGRLDLTGFRLFELSQPKVGEIKPFGARFASVELDLATNVWVVKLEPESGVFITHPRALEAIDWPTFDAPEEGRP